jgi:hypothetical protein
MGIGASIFLIAVGAILKFAVTPPSNNHGIDINMVGLILMIVGAIGLLATLLFVRSWGGPRRDTVVRDRDYL